MEIKHGVSSSWLEIKKLQAYAFIAEKHIAYFCCVLGEISVWRS